MALGPVVTKTPRELNMGAQSRKPKVRVGKVLQGMLKDE